MSLAEEVGEERYVSTLCPVDNSSITCGQLKKNQVGAQQVREVHNVQ